MGTKKLRVVALRSKRKKTLDKNNGHQIIKRGCTEIKKEKH